MTIIVYAVINKKRKGIKMVKTISRDKIVRRSRAIIRVLAPRYNSWTLTLLGHKGLNQLYNNHKKMIDFHF